MVGTDVLAIELDLERNREKEIQKRTLQSMAEVRGVWVDVYATAISVIAELTFVQYDSESVIEFLKKTVDDVAAAGIESLSRHMSALLANYLVELGDPDAADQTWRNNRLPCEAGELDLERQSWRTMEALSCARVRLLTAQGECAAAEALASSLCDLAAERGLTRTLLRGLALSMVVAHVAGDENRAVARLIEFLRLTREVDYVRPLVRHREVSRTVLRCLLDTDAEEDVRRAAESTLVQLEPSTTKASGFSAREREVPDRTPTRAHSRFPGHALTPTGVMAIRCKQFHLPDL